MYSQFEEVRDHGFDEPDDSYLFTNTDGEEIGLLKNRVWFDCKETFESDFYITWTITVNKKTFMTFPKGVERETATSFAQMQWQEDKEETKERESYEAELASEYRMRARGIQW